jgi:hypothetical protein
MMLQIGPSRPTMTVTATVDWMPILMLLHLMMTMTEPLGLLCHLMPKTIIPPVPVVSTKCVANALAGSSAAGDTSDNQGVYTAERTRPILISLGTNTVRDEALSLNSPKRGTDPC